MRVLLLENSLNDLLSSRVELGRYLKDSDYDVFLFAKDEIRKKGLDYSTFRLSGLGFLMLLLEINRIKPNVILSFRIESHFLSSIFKRLLGLRVIYVVTGLGRYFNLQNGAIGFRGFVLKNYYKYIVARSSDPVIVQNGADAKFFLKLNPKLDVRVIKGSGVNRFVSIPLNKDMKPKFYFAGRCLEEKGIKIAVDSVIRWNCNNPVRQVKLDVYGCCKDEYREKIDSDYSDNEFVDFLGWQNLTNEKVGKYWALINPSKYREGIPRVVLQAYACGVPAILSRVPGNDEMIIGELQLDFNLDKTENVQHCISNALILDRDLASSKCRMKLENEGAYTEDVYKAFKELLS